MQRNMELIKAILIDLEEHCNATTIYQPNVSDYHDFAELTNDIFMDHCRLIAERGLANGQLIRNGWGFTSLTWDGHDFLDNSRESKVWDAAKRAAGNLSFGVFQEVLLRAASAFALKQLGLQ